MSAQALYQYAFDNGGWMLGRNGYVTEWDDWFSTGGWSAGRCLGQRLYVHLSIRERKRRACAWTLHFGPFPNSSCDGQDTYSGKCTSVREAVDGANALMRDGEPLRKYLVYRYREQCARTLYRLDADAKTATPYLSYFYPLFDMFTVPVGAYVDVYTGYRGEVCRNVVDRFWYGHSGGTIDREKLPWLDPDVLPLRGAVDVITFDKESTHGRDTV